jgi:hypothetical protein
MLLTRVELGSIMYLMRNSGKLFFALLALTAIAFGQGAVGTLNGTVTDQAGAVVPGAAVVATNQATGVESKTTTTSGGDYTLPYLPAGTYTIRVTAPGFRIAAAENTILRVAQTMTIDVKLQVGAVTESVIVSDKPELLESDSAEIGQYITAEEYKAWPILVDDGQRQIQQFIFDSLPGTTGSTFQGSINGGQQYSHEILIDGIPVGRADLSGGNNNEFSPSAEAIGEFKLQTGAIGAQYNGGQTAVANFTIKSGGNALHASGFYYLGNEDFNSIPIQTKTLGGSNPRNRLNNWGYSAGGPVFVPKVYNGHNKTFFFTNLEKTSVNNLVLSALETFRSYSILPTQATRNRARSLEPMHSGAPSYLARSTIRPRLARLRMAQSFATRSRETSFRRRDSMRSRKGYSPSGFPPLSSTRCCAMSSASALPRRIFTNTSWARRSITR